MQILNMKIMNFEYINFKDDLSMFKCLVAIEITKKSSTKT